MPFKGSFISGFLVWNVLYLQRPIYQLSDLSVEFLEQPSCFVLFQVEICGTSWTYNPALVTKVASGTESPSVGASAGGEMYFSLGTKSSITAYRR